MNNEEQKIITFNDNDDKYDGVSPSLLEKEVFTLSQSPLVTSLVELSEEAQQQKIVLSKAETDHMIQLAQSMGYVDSKHKQHPTGHHKAHKAKRKAASNARKLNR